MKVIKGYRTLAINLLSAAVMVAELQEWYDVLPNEYHGYFGLGLALANMVLRYVTTTPVGARE